MNKITCLLLALLIVSCSAKQTRKNLDSGNYDDAIEIAVNSLRNNKEKKGKQEYIYMLEEAFAKAKERDMREIEMLAKDANTANLEKLFETYTQMNNRQELIRPLLPLKLIKENRNAMFPFENYSDEIVSSKNALSEYLYGNASKSLKTAKKDEARKIYDDLMYLNSISPNYKDSRKLADEARFRGTDFVWVYTKNETNMMIPSRLQSDLLDFSTMGLDDKWTAYHSRREKGIDYQYAIAVAFRDIQVSPEQVKEKESIREKEIKVGRKKLKDRNGHVVLDSLDHPVMVDDIRTVRAKINEFRQFKACQVTAKVDYLDFKSNRLLQSFPLSSEFIFENIYATCKGDRRAVEEDYRKFFDKRPVPFPPSDQMVYDTGEDLKAKLKAIISKNKIRG
ncbi:MAG: hypothetical protein EOO51_05705 [Flavobacterium sp.]|nr:MAG: hypothetical protein EOO51_05705 [Flavobacterium sp.]